MRCSALLLSCGLLAGATTGVAAAADVYKWTDAEGKVHFSDSPPPDVTNAVKTAIISAPTDTARLELLDAAAGLRAKQAAAEGEIRANQEKRATEERAAKQQACDAAKKFYEGMQYSRKFSYVDKDGKEQWLSGADADKKKQDAKAKVDEACAGL